MQLHNILILSIELLAILIGIYYWQVLSIPYRLFWLQVLLSCSNEFVAWMIQHYWGFNNVPLFNVYAIVEMLLLGTACRLLFTRSSLKKFLNIGLFAVSIYWLAVVIIDGITLFNNHVFVAIALFNVIYFFCLLIDNSIFNKKELYKQPLFLIAVASILYFATVIPFFGLMNYLTNSDMTLAIKLFKINISAAILRYSLVAAAFYLYARQAKKAYVR